MLDVVTGCCGTINNAETVGVGTVDNVGIAGLIAATVGVGTVAGLDSLIASYFGSGDSFV